MKVVARPGPKYALGLGMSTRPPSLVRGQHRGRTLELRPGRPQDAPELIDLIESSLPELRVFMPFAHKENTIDQQYERLVNTQGDYWGDGDKVFHLWEDDRLIGCFGLHKRTLNSAGFEMGYLLRSEVAGQGVATFAVQCLLVLCFDHFGSERVQLAYNEANEASRRIAEKCGFTIEGRLRRFETASTPEMIANGASEEPSTLMSSMIRDDLTGLAWLEEVRAGMEVLDWRGEPLTLSGE